MTAHPLDGLGPGETRQVTFGVTQEDIDQGHACHCWECPAALALNRAFPGLIAEVSTSGGVTLYEDTGEHHPGLLRYWAPVTDDLIAFIRRIDAYEQAPPGEFTLTFQCWG